MYQMLGGLTLRLIGALSAFIINIYVINLLGVVAAANFFYVFTLTSVFSSVLTFGFYNYVMSRSVALSNLFFGQFFYVSLLLLIPTSLVCSLTCFLLNFDFYSTVMTNLINVPLSIVTAYSGYLNKGGKYLASVFFQSVAAQFLFLISLICLDFSQTNISPSDVVIGYALSSYIILLLVLCKSKLFLPRKRVIYLMFVRATPFFIIVFSAQIYMWGVNISSMYTLQKFDYSALVVIQRVAFAIGIIVSVIDSFSAGKIYAASKEVGNATLAILMNKLTLLSLVICIPISMIIFIFPDSIIRVFSQDLAVFGHELLIVCAAQLVNCATGPTGTFLMMTGYQKVYRRLVLMISVMSIVSAYYFGRQFGLEIVCYILLLSSLIQNGFCFFYIKHKFNFFPLDYFIVKKILTSKCE